MIRTPLLAALALFPASAFADTQLERFEELAEKMNVVMVQMMANEVESQGGDASALRELDTMMPPWTDEIRAAADCILDDYNDFSSASEVDAMLERMETALPQLATMAMTEAEETGLLDTLTPEGMSDDRMMEINRECGMMELQMEAASNSGFMEAMMTAGRTIPGNN